MRQYDRSNGWQKPKLRQFASRKGTSRAGLPKALSQRLPVVPILSRCMRRQSRWRLPFWKRCFRGLRVILTAGRCTWMGPIVGYVPRSTGHYAARGSATWLSTLFTNRHSEPPAGLIAYRSFEKPLRTRESCATYRISIDSKGILQVRLRLQHLPDIRWRNPIVTSWAEPRSQRSGVYSD